MTPKEKLINWLRKEKNIDVPTDVMVDRTYAGRHQKAAGSYSSFFHSYKNSLFDIGMYRPMAELIKCPNLILENDKYCGLYIDCGCIGTCKSNNKNKSRSNIINNK